MRTHMHMETWPTASPCTATWACNYILCWLLTSAIHAPRHFPGESAECRRLMRAIDRPRVGKTSKWLEAAVV